MKRMLLNAAVGLLTAAVIGAPFAYAAGLFNGYPIGNGASYCSGYSGYSTSTTTPGSTVPTPNQCNSTVPAGPALTGNEYVPMDTITPGALTQTAPSTVIVPSATAAGLVFNGPKNMLGNGAFLVTQENGTSTVTCATTSAPTIAAISADRWICDANVTSGAGRTAVITASPAPPTGFTNSLKMFRTSGALTQPICSWSAVPTPEATQAAGQSVTFSAYVAALAGLSADNGNVANLVIISGTGTDEALNGSWTASPAITPAWTGITTVVNTSINLTTTFARFSTTATIPTTATEIGVGICFTPSATGAGATDGLAFTGAQLERAPAMSTFEVRRKADEIQTAQQHLYVIKEGAVGSMRAPCVTSTTSLATCLLQFPNTMYKTPTMSYTSGFGACTTTACTALVACTATRTSTLIAGFAADANRVPVDCTSTAGFAAAGSASYLADDAGSGVITAWTGF